MGAPDPTAAPDMHFTLVGSIPQSRPQGGRRPHAAAASSVGALLQPDPTAGAKPDSHFTLHNGVAIGRQHGGRRHIDGANVTSVGRALREEIGGAPRKVEALRWRPARRRRRAARRRRAGAPGGRAARRRAARRRAGAGRGVSAATAHGGSRAGLEPDRARGGAAARGAQTAQRYSADAAGEGLLARFLDSADRARLARPQLTCSSA